MKLVFGIVAIIFASGLFLVNFSLGVFDFLPAPSFSPDKNIQDSTVFDGLVQQIEQAKPNFAVEELKKTIAAPEPLRVFREEPREILAIEKVLAATNAHRQKNGLSNLSRNITLDKVARAKITDMFMLQYFEHESPGGVLFTDIAERFGYEYLAMGENLALGRYESEEVLMRAWMDSPGHRANILHTKYSEIGLAVEKGIFEGQEVWLAVQTFGLPLSACPSQDEELKTEISIKKLEINELQLLLDVSREELHGMQFKQNRAYQKKADAFNSLVEQYNRTVSETQTLITGYNIQVETFNKCAEAGN
jgi:uncharacterized protein YkwD